MPFTHQPVETDVCDWRHLKFFWPKSCHIEGVACNMWRSLIIAFNTFNTIQRNCRAFRWHKTVRSNCRDKIGAALASTMFFVLILLMSMEMFAQIFGQTCLSKGQYSLLDIS